MLRSYARSERVAGVSATVAAAPQRVRVSVSQATVRRYHEQTKHRPGGPAQARTGSIGRALFKRYPALHPEPTPEDLGRLLRVAAGVHPRRGDPHYRTFMSAGALDPVEVYGVARCSASSDRRPPPPLDNAAAIAIRCRGAADNVI
jgi:hypothetical protein